MGDLPSVIKQSGQVQFSSSVSGFPQDDPRNIGKYPKCRFATELFFSLLLNFFDTGNGKFFFPLQL